MTRRIDIGSIKKVNESATSHGGKSHTGALTGSSNKVMAGSPTQKKANGKKTNIKNSKRRHE